MPYDITSCSSELPIIEVHLDTNLTLQVDSLIFQNIALSFIIDDTVSSIASPLLTATATSTLTINNTCFLESGSYNTYQVAAFESQSSLNMNGNIFQRVTGLAYNFDSPSQTYNDILVIVQNTQSPTETYLQINYNGNSTYNVSITNITISPNSNSWSDNMLSVYNGYSLTINQINISGSQLQFQSSVFSIQVTNFNISNLTLEGLNIQDLSYCYGGGTLFTISGTETSNIEFVVLKDLTINCFVPFIFNFNAESNVTIQNIDIMNITGSLSPFNMANISQNLNLRARDFVVADFTGTLFIIQATTLNGLDFEAANFSITDFDGSLTIFYTNTENQDSNFSLENFSITNSVLDYSNLDPNPISQGSPIILNPLVMPGIYFDNSGSGFGSVTEEDYTYEYEELQTVCGISNWVAYVSIINDELIFYCVFPWSSIFFYPSTPGNVVFQATNFAIANITSPYPIAIFQAFDTGTLDFEAINFDFVDVQGSLSIFSSNNYTLGSLNFEATNFTVANSVLSSSNIFYTGNISNRCYIQLENFTFYNNTISQSSILNYTTGTSSLAGTALNVINLTQWNISYCNFTSSFVFFSKYSQTSSWEIDQERILVNNLTFNNNIMNSQNTSTNYGIFTLYLSYARFSQIQVSNNQFYQDTGFITAPDYIPNVLIIDSTIEDNLFFEANFVSLNMSQTAYGQLPTTPSTARLLRVLYIASTSFVKNYLYATTLIQSSNPQVYIINCEFYKINFMVDSQLISLGNLQQTTNFPYTERNITEENLVFANDSDLLSILNRMPSDGWSFSSMALFEYVIAGNEFKNLRADTFMSVVDISSFSLSGSQVLIAENNIEVISSANNDQTPLFSFDTINSFNVSGNYFHSVNTSSTIFTFQNLARKSKR